MSRVIRTAKRVICSQTTATASEHSYAGSKRYSSIFDLVPADICGLVLTWIPPSDYRAVLQLHAFCSVLQAWLPHWQSAHPAVDWLLPYLEQEDYNALGEIRRLLLCPLFTYDVNVPLLWKIHQATLGHASFDWVLYAIGAKLPHLSYDTHAQEHRSLVGDFRRRVAQHRDREISTFYETHIEVMHDLLPVYLANICADIKTQAELEANYGRIRRLVYAEFFRLCGPDGAEETRKQSESETATPTPTACMVSM